MKTYQTYIRLSKVCKEYPMGTLLKELIHEGKDEAEKILSKQEIVKEEKWN